MRNTPLFHFLLFIFIPFAGISQILEPKASTVYDDSNLGRMDITINSADLDFILDPENENSDEEFSATFKYQSTERNDLEENIGFRLRGNTSRASQKKSFKVSFNSFEKGRDLNGFEKLNLNGEHNDPTMIRSKIAWDLFNAMDVPSSRANLVEFYINNEYRGLYINVEHVDEEFIEERFGDKEGNLFKCLYPADLNYKGDDPEAYKEVIYGRRAYELKMNEDRDDYSGFANFMWVLNRAPDAQFEDRILEVFDVVSYLKALAVETLIGHWDNYGMNQNNFYLYENPMDNKFYYIPFDLDNTLGVDFFNKDWAEVDIYEWYNKSEHRPLTERIMAVPSFRAEYTRIMDRLLSQHFSPEALNPRINELKVQIQDAAERDTYRTLDYGFTIDDFNKSFTDRLDQFQVRYGLKEFIARRYETAIAQLDEVIELGTSMESSRLNIYPNPSNGNFQLDFKSNWSGNISIKGLDGRSLYELDMSGNTLDLELDVPDGLYFIHLSPANGSKPSIRKVLIAD